MRTWRTVYVGILESDRVLKIDDSIKIKTFLTTFSMETFHDEVSEI
jgi:hypothetical protein